MADDKKTKTFLPPLKGLNDVLNASVIDDLEATEMINARVSDAGVLEKYPGFTTDGSPFPASSSSFIRSILNFKRGTAIDWLLVCAYDSGNANANYKVDFKYTTGNGTYSYFGHTTGTASFTNGNATVTGTSTDWSTQLKPGDKIKLTADADSKYVEILSIASDTSLTLTSNYTGSTASGAYIARIILHQANVPAMTVFNNVAIISNGSENMMYFDSNNMQLITTQTAPKAYFLEPHKNRLFAANTPGNPSGLYWSNPFDQTAWDAAALDQIYPQDNGSIVAIKSFGDSLMVFKDNGNIYQVIGNFDIAPGKIAYTRKIDYSNKTIGTIAGRSVTTHRGFLYFLASGGYFVIDQRMTCQKVTRNADTFISGLNFKPTGTVSKQFPFQTVDQWNSGTFSGTNVTSAGKLQPYADAYTLTDLKTTVVGGVSAPIVVTMDSNLKIHLAYIDTTANTILRYRTYDTSGTTTTEVAATFATQIGSISIALDNSGNPAIAVSLIAGSVYFIYKTSGSWGQIEKAYNSATATSLSLKFRVSDNAARIAILDAGQTFKYLKRSGINSWATAASTFTVTATNTIGYVLDSSDNPIVVAADTTGSNGFTWGYSQDDGATITTAHVGTTNVVHNGPFAQLNSVGHPYFVWGSTTGNYIKRYDATSGTTTTIDASYGNLIGYTLKNDRDQVYFWKDVAGTGKESWYWDQSNSVDAQTATLNESFGVLASPYNNTFCVVGNVFASVAITTTASNARIRRISFNSSWIGPQVSDNTMTAWGNFTTVDNGTNNITYSVATNSISPASTYKTITNGTLIDSNTANVFASPKVTFTFATVDQVPGITSIIMPYTGGNTDSKEPCGMSHNNELYFCAAKTGDSNNDWLLISDLNESLLKNTYNINCFERYKDKLYAGSSLQGDVYILKQGNYNGTMDVQTKEFFLESLELQKDLYKIYFLYNTQSSGTLTVSYRLDNFATAGGSSWISNTIDLTKAGPYEVANITPNTCRSIQFRFQNSESNTVLNTISWSLVFRYLDRR